MAGRNEGGGGEGFAQLTVDGRDDGGVDEAAGFEQLTVAAWGDGGVAEGGGRATDAGCPGRDGTLDEAGVRLFFGVVLTQRVGD
jgi:hypothetical protein